MMKLQFHTEALAMLYYLQKAGWEAYLVGGAVRDIFLRAMEVEGAHPKGTCLEGRATQIDAEYDYDLTTNAPPEKILEVLGEEAFYENDFGTVSIAPEKWREFLLGRGMRIETEAVVSGKNGSESESKSESESEGERRIIDYLAATKIHESLKLPEEMIGAEEKERELAKKLARKSNLGNYEITTYRSGEVYEQDFRHPTKMEWGKSILEDLGRRDLTINAMAVKVNQAWLMRIFENGGGEKVGGAPLPEILVLEEGVAEMIDQYGGRTDLENKLIRCVGESTVRFEEDALRMLRAVRFGAQLNFQLEEQTWGGIKAKADLLEFISQERIRDELLKMLSSNYPAEAIEVLDETGLLKWILPELIDCKGVNQAGSHHQDDVWNHSINALRYCPSRDPIVRLATLLHDIGKAVTARWDGTRMTFYNHQMVGAKMAARVGRRLRLSKEENERVYNLVRHHMFHYQSHDTDAAVRRLMREVGLENLDDLLALRIGDRLGSGSKETSWRMEELKRRMIEQLHQPLDVRDLKVDGNDLMQELGLKPGRILGEILGHLLEVVLEESELNTREVLLEKAREFLTGRESQAVDTPEGEW